MTDDTGYVQFDPTIGNYPVLRKSGWYGPGRENEADVEISEFWADASKHDNEFKRRPAFDKDGKRGPYCYFHFLFKTQDFGLVHVDHWEPTSPNSGSKALQLIKDAGVEVNEQGGFNPQSLQGLALGGVKMGEPVVAKDGSGKLYNGRVLEVAAR